jgi:hypothetical protein
MAHKAQQLILHFGLPKTGTSALQSALFEQREELLKKHNTLYPGSYENHHFLQALFSKRPERQVQIKRLELERGQAITRFLEDYRQNMLAEIEQTKPDRIIISSEYFTSMSVEGLAAVHEFFKSFAENIELFAYIRDPWSWSLSLAQEHIRTGWWKKEVKVTYRDHPVDTFDKFEKAFETVCTAAPYTPGTDIVTDFCNRFGLLNLDLNITKYRAVNYSMQKESACVMLELNQLYPVFDENERFIIDHARDWMAEAIQSSPLSTTPLRISTSTAKEIYEKSRNDFETLERRYFAGKRFLSEQYDRLKTSDFDDTLSISTFAVEQLSEYLLSCMHVLAEELSEIRDSKAWKAVVAFRRLRVTLVPINSHRDRLWRRLMDGIFFLFGIFRRKQN